MTPRLFYRILAVAEAITCPLLLAALVPQSPVAVADCPVTVPGPPPRFVFIAYAITAALIGVNQRWRLPLVVLAVATAIVPYATVPFDVWADRTGRLDGGWRTTPTEDPRDHTWFGRLFRWMLTHVAVLATSLAVLAVVIMVALLVIGPPKLS